MTPLRIAIASAALAIPLLVPTGAARGDVTYGFTAISSNNVVDAEAGQNQLQVDVAKYDDLDTKVLFIFSHVEKEAVYCSITDIYFDDGTLLGIAQLIDAENGGLAGVRFTTLASPSELPEANTLDPVFVTTAGVPTRAMAARVRVC